MCCAAILVIYSVTNKKSFSTAADILYQLRDTYSDVAPIILVANKVDLERQRAIQTSGNFCYHFQEIRKKKRSQ